MLRFSWSRLPAAIGKGSAFTRRRLRPRRAGPGRRLRRSRVYGGFVFVLVLCARWFSVVSLVLPPASGLLRGGFVFAKLTTFLEFCGRIADLGLLFVAFWEVRLALT